MFSQGEELMRGGEFRLQADRLVQVGDGQLIFACVDERGAGLEQFDRLLLRVGTALVDAVKRAKEKAEQQKSHAEKGPFE